MAKDNFFTKKITDFFKRMSLSFLNFCGMKTVELFNFFWEKVKKNVLLLFGFIVRINFLGKIVVFLSPWAKLFLFVLRKTGLDKFVFSEKNMAFYAKIKKYIHVFILVVLFVVKKTKKRFDKLEMKYKFVWVVAAVILIGRYFFSPVHLEGRIIILRADADLPGGQCGQLNKPQLCNQSSCLTLNVDEKECLNEYRFLAGKIVDIWGRYINIDFADAEGCEKGPYGCEEIKGLDPSKVKIKEIK